MKKLILPLFAAMLLLSCNGTDEAVAPSNNTVGIRANNNQKVDICHNGHIINVSVNAIPAHRMHGDAIDYDGDGYFSGPNNCNKPEDCDDNDAGHTNNCCVTGEWCGLINPRQTHLSFNVNCTTTVVYENTPCQNGPITWTVVSVNGNVTIYQENNPCGDDCTVTVVDNGNSLDVTFSCDNDSLNGTLYHCEE